MDDYIIKRLNYFDDTICTLWGLNTTSYSDVLAIALIIFKDLLEYENISYDDLKERVFDKINNIIESNL